MPATKLVKMMPSIFIGLLAMQILFCSSGYGANEIDPSCSIPQGIIEVDSDFAKKIGFISKRFMSCSHLWGEGNRIIIQTIECTDRRRGYLRELFRAIWDLGAEIAVLTPLSTMEAILVHYGFRKTMIKDTISGRSELWIK